MFKFKQRITKKDILIYVLINEFHYTAEELVGLSNKSLNNLMVDLLKVKNVQKVSRKSVNN